ncbi:MAG: LD-carboxypeptidase [Aerococcaceae bacterium]|nr:LD-carboxypeptidase [Aerococcaceae bacterium]
MLPARLQLGDEIRVVSPSSSMASIGGMEANEAAKQHLEQLGYVVTFGKHIHENDRLHSASIESRVSDLHDAFRDPNVKAILATIGGYNSNELLPHLDYELIRASPKIICGYSDTTALTNAIFAQTGLITYSGASYSSFKMTALQEYQTRMWLRAVTETAYALQPSEQWSSDEWFLPHCEREFFPTQWKVYQAGKARGTSIAGNLSTFSLLRGTPYFPQVEAPILFIESAEGYDYLQFARYLAALFQAIPQPKAVLIGRFPKECQMTETLLHYILDKYPILRQIPVMYDIDFGHTQPFFTFPIGACVEVNTAQLSIRVSGR